MYVIKEANFCFHKTHTVPLLNGKLTKVSDSFAQNDVPLTVFKILSYMFATQLIRTVLNANKIIDKFNTNNISIEL